MKFMLLFTVAWCGHQSLLEYQTRPSLCAHWSAPYSHRSLSSLTKLPCVVTDRSLRSLICPVQWAITLCAHQSALCPHLSLCALPNLPCVDTDPSVRPPIVAWTHRSLCAITDLSMCSPIYPLQWAIILCTYWSALQVGECRLWSVTA